MPSDTTTLNPMAGGDVIDTEYIAARTAKLERIKMVLGALDTDGGDVSTSNPMPVAGNIADQAADSGNSVKVGMVYYGTVQTPATGVRMPLNSDGFGNALVSLGVAISLIVGGFEAHTIGVAPFRRIDAFEAILENANITTATQIQAGVSGKSIYITDISISTDTIGWIDIEDNAGSPNDVIPRKYFNTNGFFTHTYATPKQVVQGNSLMAIAQNAGNVSIEVNGYIY